jgi:RND family efflux transporter MFP subunit
MGLVALLSAEGTCCNDAARRPGGQPAAVEAAPIARETITLRRTYSGSLEAAAQFVVAPKVSGRVQRVHVDIGDPVERGQVVVELDDDEYRQQVAQAQADLAVARANRAEADSALEIARRELERVSTLSERGIASDTRLDAVRAAQHAAEAKHEVAGAQVVRATAALQGARVRLAYTRVTADWAEGDDRRVVAERFIDEGATVSANTPLLSIVELDPIVGVIYVPERDYAHLAIGQAVTLSTDAHPGETFAAEVRRVAPVFRPGSRQARVELLLPNSEHRLNPGLFIRASVALDRADDAVVVPRAALTTRGDVTGVFIIDADGGHVSWHEVQVGIREEERVQVKGEGLSGRVVTLGQQLLDDGSAVVVPEAPPPAASAKERGAE